VLALNTGSNLILMLNKIVVTLVMTPIYLKNMGEYDYGVWEIVGGIVGYMGLLDIGMRPSVSRYVARYRALDDSENLNIVFASSFIFMTILGVVCSIAMLISAYFISSTLSLSSGAGVESYHLFFYAMAMQVAISFPCYVLDSYLEGAQRYVIKNNVSIVLTIVGAMTVVYFVDTENALYLLAFVASMSTLIRLGVYWLLLFWQSDKNIHFSVNNFSFVKLKELLVFGSKSFLQGITGRVETSTDTLIIGSILGPQFVPFYHIPSSLAGYMRGIGWTLTHAFMPMFSSMYASKDDRIEELYLQSSKVVVAIMVGMATGICFIGGDFLAVWLSPEFKEKGERVLIIITLFVMVPFLIPFSNRFLTAMNKHGFIAKLAPFSALLNLALSILLIGPYGVEGVAIASLVSSLVFVPIHMVYVSRYLECSVGRYFLVCIFPAILPALTMLVSLQLVSRHFSLDSFLNIAALCFIGLIVWIIVFYLVVLNHAQKGKIRALIHASIVRQGD